MYPTQFEYVRPSSVDEAIAILAADSDAKVLAGGHSLIPAMKLRLAAPGTIVDIGKIDGLKGVSSNGSVTIGAMTTYRGIIDADGLDQFPVVQAATRQVGDIQVRNRGTLGGSLAHNDPAADLTAVMLALNALDAVDADPTPAWRGTMVHAVFDAWMKEAGCDPARLPEADLARLTHERRSGGLGFHVMQLLMDEVSYEIVSGQTNRLRMTKKLR